MSEPTDTGGETYLDGLLTAVAVLPEADLAPVEETLTADQAGADTAVDRAALAVAVAHCESRLAEGRREPPFDADSANAARQWLAGFFRGVGLYPDRWQALTGSHPDSAYSLLVLAALLDPDTGARLPGAKDAIARLADDPTLVPGLVSTIYRDLRDGGTAPRESG